LIRGKELDERKEGSLEKERKEKTEKRTRKDCGESDFASVERPTGNRGGWGEGTRNAVRLQNQGVKKVWDPPPIREIMVRFLYGEKGETRGIGGGIPIRVGLGLRKEAEMVLRSVRLRRVGGHLHRRRGIRKREAPEDIGLNNKKNWDGEICI